MRRSSACHHVTLYHDERGTSVHIFSSILTERHLFCERASPVFVYDDIAVFKFSLVYHSHLVLIFMVRGPP